MLKPKKNCWPRKISCTNSGVRVALVLSFLFPALLLAQPSEATLAQLGQSYLVAQNDSLRIERSRVFADSLWSFLSFPQHFAQDLPQVRNLSVQYPEDRTFALYTWTVPLSTGQFLFHGILWNPSWKDQPRVVLEDFGDSEAAPYQWLRDGQFVGGLCYDIITTKYRGEKQYTLLLFRPGRIHHTKIVDAVVLGNQSRKLRFGNRVFNIRSNSDEVYQKRPYRIWFRYNSSVTAAVRWEDRHRGIICDHLSPSKPSLKGFWYAYGPDFSYDRLQWKKGQWHLDEAYPLIRNIQQAPTNGTVPTTLRREEGTKKPDRE